MKKIWKCLVIIIGTFVGAGFASGQEMLSFFNRFPEAGIGGVLLAMFLFGLVIMMTLQISHKDNIQEYAQLIHHNRFFILVVKVFTFICFCIMIAAIGAYIEEQFGLSFWLGTLTISFLCFITFLLKYTGLEKINIVLVPIILIGIILVSIGAMNGKIVFSSVEQQMNSHYPFLNNWVQAAFLYVGYNTILLIPILLELKRYCLKKSEILLLTIGVGGIIGVIGVCIWNTMSIYLFSIGNAEMPMLMIAKNINLFIYGYYSAAILFAIFTTAFSCGYAFLKMGKEKNYFSNCIAICLLGVLFSRIGFSNLVNICFPLFGYFGIAQWGYIIWLHQRKHKNGKG